MLTFDIKKDDGSIKTIYFHKTFDDKKVSVAFNNLSDDIKQSIKNKSQASAYINRQIDKEKLKDYQSVYDYALLHQYAYISKKEKNVENFSDFSKLIYCGGCLSTEYAEYNIMYLKEHYDIADRFIDITIQRKGFFKKYEYIKMYSKYTSKYIIAYLTVNRIFSLLESEGWHIKKIKKNEIIFEPTYPYYINIRTGVITNAFNGIPVTYFVHKAYYIMKVINEHNLKYINDSIVGHESQKEDIYEAHKILSEEFICSDVKWCETERFYYINIDN